MCRYSLSKPYPWIVIVCPILLPIDVFLKSFTVILKSNGHLPCGTLRLTGVRIPAQQKLKNHFLEAFLRLRIEQIMQCKVWHM